MLLFMKWLVLAPGLPLLVLSNRVSALLGIMAGLLLLIKATCPFTLWLMIGGRVMKRTGAPWTPPVQFLQ